MAKKINIPTNSRTAETIAGILDPSQDFQERQESIKRQIEENKKNMEQPKRRGNYNPDLIRGNGVQAGLTKDYTRATMIFKVEYLEELKNIAYTDRKPIKDILEEIIKDYLDRYSKENKNKEILKAPKRGGKNDNTW